MSVFEPDSNVYINSFLFSCVWPTRCTSPELSASIEYTVRPSILFAVNWVVVWFFILPSYPILTVSTVVKVSVLFALVNATFKSPNMSIAEVDAIVTSLPGAA